MIEQRVGLNFKVMRQAIENLDADRLVSLYADDAEMLTVNRYTTPSSPKVLKGMEEIAEHLRDVCGRAMSHRIETLGKSP
jgi:ketosteroid isomerase-like protein